MQNLVDKLIETGLLQFGLFGDAPYNLRLDLLPSYPDVLHLIADAALDHLPACERLVCLPGSMPFAIAACVKSNIPLVYSQGSDQAAAFDLVGAYDTGHPAVLLLNVWTGKDSAIEVLISKAARVGLSITAVMAICSSGKTLSVPVLSLVLLDEAIVYLAETGQLPPGQAEAVKTYLNM